MSKIGPYQFCDSCKCEKSHTWIGELCYRCNSCGRESRITTRPAFKQLPLKSPEQKMAEYNAEHSDSQGRVEYLTTEQVQEKYDTLYETVKGKMEEEVAKTRTKIHEEVKPKPTLGWGAKLR